MTDIPIYVAFDSSRDLSDTTLFSDITDSTWELQSDPVVGTPILHFVSDLSDAQVREVVWRATMSPNEEQMMSGLQNAIGSLQQITATTGTLTALQLSNAVRLLARVCIWLLRLKVQDYSSTN